MNKKPKKSLPWGEFCGIVSPYRHCAEENILVLPKRKSHKSKRRCNPHEQVRIGVGFESCTGR